MFILFLILFSATAYCDMPSLVGQVELSTPTFQNIVYNYLVNNSTESINNVISKYEIHTATYNVYGVNMIIQLPTIKLSVRDKIRKYIHDYIGDSRVKRCRLGVYTSHNNNAICTPDSIQEWELKQ